MPKGANQKLKLYYLAKIMVGKTDDDHMLTMPEIQKHLLEYGVTADRKSLYDDMEALRTLGIDVIGEQIGRGYYYHVGKKHFEIAELKLLVDAIQSSKFITEKKSSELIKKLTGLVSEYEASQMKRQVVVHGRIKTMNESIYYNVDKLHTAISQNSGIRMDYMKWNLKKELVPTEKGCYEISPWALTWDDENYYLIAYDSEDEKIKHFRVDKMDHIELTGEKREGRQLFRNFDMASYARNQFGMYAGREQKVKIAFKNELVGVMIDRFGKDIPVRGTKERGWSQTTVDVAVSNQFFGWIFGLGGDAKITAPEDVVKQFKNEMQSAIKLY
ncbi:MAG: WYL domain-containing protein [Lachnospiraceae bacterium]|nr:WYL domain-containing protein [Lachnospiraceae bacterium]